jgi:hypothetical protein
MNKNKYYVAYHEAGHAVACVLCDVQFELVTVKSVVRSLEWESLGHVEFPVSSINLLPYHSTTDPLWFNEFFIRDFINVAGSAAESIYKNNPHIRLGITDKQNIFARLPEPLRQQYIKFLRQYAVTVFTIPMNWQFIDVIARALIAKETLTYDEVIHLNSMTWKP